MALSARPGWPSVENPRQRASLSDSALSQPDSQNRDSVTKPANKSYPIRPALKSSANSEDTIRATPPMNIPSSVEHAIEFTSPRDTEDPEQSYMDRFMRGRQPSITFDQTVVTDSGDRQSINDPFERKTLPRGRSMLQALAEAQNHENKARRSHSESSQDHYDPLTGRHLPKWSNSPPRDEPHVGEARFPLLQRTVDEMARESQSHLPHTLSLTTDTVFSPEVDELHTPRERAFQSPSSPVPISSQPPVISPNSSPYSPFRRTASERWKSGENAQDFFSRAGSIKKSKRTNSWRDFRPKGANVSSMPKSPSSAASSYLRGFSVGSGSNDDSPSVAVDAEGQTIGDDYVLGKQIGFGGFSVVKEVTQMSPDTGQQRKLAVKIVLRHIDGKSEAENEAAQAEFEHEVELWRFLDHPNILRLEAVYKLDEATFCFIPLNTGGTLFDVIRANRQGLPSDQARNYAFQLAQALRYLHLDARVVHRDVKLENCLVDTVATSGEHGHLRLCDFGMAEWLSNDSVFDMASPGPRPSSHEPERPPPKFLGPADSSTAAFAGGSLEYAAPEIIRRASNTDPSIQVAGDQANSEAASAGRGIVSPAVDIWAFGVCLYALVMGKRPFSDSFMPRVVMAILAADWNRKALLEKAQDDSLVDLVEGCLQKVERDRWDISDVIDCTWFRQERQKQQPTEDDGRNAWRL